MYKICKSDKSQQRQRELEQGLLRAMLRRQYEDISVSELCQQMQMPRKSFYRYFIGKDGCLHALIDHAMMDFELMITRDVPASTEDPLRYMQFVFSYWKGQKKLLDALQHSGISGLLVQRAMEYAKETELWPIFLRSPVEQQRRNFTMLFTVCGIMTIITQWHHDGFIESVEEMAEIALRLVSEPLYANVKR